LTPASLLGKLNPSDEARSALTAPNRRDRLMASTEYVSVEAFLFAGNGSVR